MNVIAELVERGLRYAYDFGAEGRIMKKHYSKDLLSDKEITKKVKSLAHSKSLEPAAISVVVRELNREKLTEDLCKSSVS